VEKGKEWQKRGEERWRNVSEAWRETGALFGSRVDMMFSAAA
jgi:hypothetical protein